MNELQDVSSKIVQLIEEKPDKAILGVHLGYMLRRYFPAFSPTLYRCRNLRQFIRENVPSVREAGYSGADVRYGLVSVGNPQIALPIVQAPTPPPAQLISSSDFMPLPVSPYVWKAYSNPGHPFHIAVNQDTGEVRTVSSDSAPPSPWLIVPKPTTEFLTETAREFALTLSEPLKTKFTQLLLDPKWYVQFSAEAKKYGIATQWSAFRRRKLISRYNATVRDLNMKKIPTVHRGSEVRPFLSKSAANDEDAFRNILQHVVAELPISELRRLRLPVGVVFDALKK